MPKIDQYMRSTNTLFFRNINLNEVSDIEVRMEQESLRRKLHYTILDQHRLTFGVDKDTASLLKISKPAYVQVLFTHAGGMPAKTQKLTFTVDETIGGESYGD